MPRSLWVVPAIIAFGAFVGLANGVGVALVGISPLVMTLAMNVIVRGATLVAINGTPVWPHSTGGGVPDVGAHPGLASTSASSSSRVLYGSRVIVTAQALPYGRHVYAVGTNVNVARLAGIRVTAITDLRRT